MFGKKKAKATKAAPELTPFQKAAQELAATKPYDNSRYWVKGDYAIHYRVDKAEGKEKGKFFIIHGFWLNTSFYDELVVKLTEAGYTCYRVDIPDFGYSTRETKGITYVKPKDLLSDMVADLDDGKGFIVYGHSMGGSIALEVANDDKKHVNALILNAPMFMRDANEAMADRFTQPAMVNLLTAEAKLIQKLNRAVKLFIYLMTWDKDYSKNFDAKRFTAPFEVKDTGAALGFFTGHVSKPDAKELKTKKLPVQYVAGGADIFVLPPMRKGIRKALPKKADYAVVKGGGHCFPQSDAAVAADLALTFLAENKL